MEAQMCASLGSMGSVLMKLDLVLANEHRLQKKAKDGILLLKVDLEEINTKFVDLSEVADPTMAVRYWMKEVRELTYDIEDYIDQLMHSEDGSKLGSGRRVRGLKIKRFSKRLKRPPLTVDKIMGFRARVQESSERHERFGLGDCISERTRGLIGACHLPPPHRKPPALVGIEKPMNQLVKWLTDEEEQLKVISIVGPAGIGKTTLARELFRKLRGQFACRAFVQASQNPDMGRLLGSMLSQVGSNKPLHTSSVQDLIDSLREHLQDKRFFIVIDDLQAKDVWILLTKHSQSRIITTTEIKDVALACCDYQLEHTFKMEPLGDGNSRKLFLSRVFGSENKCPKRFDDVANKIIRKCSGLPLAIISIASLLARQSNKSEVWDCLDNTLTSTLMTNSSFEVVKQAVNLAYNSLPHSLKTCMLYLSIYPEGHIIWTNDLLKQWMAEGFISLTQGTEIDRVAENYFYELVNRGMIQPVDVDYNDEVISCTVHHMVLDVITNKSMEENFVTVIDCSETSIGFPHKVRRLSLRFSSTKYATKLANITLAQVRSWYFVGLTNFVPSIMEFKLLRVVILQLWGCHDGQSSFNLTNIGRLFQLRYMKISCNISVDLPLKMQGLQYLETLEINARISAIPSDIVHLPRLFHLHLPCITDLSNGIGSMRSLRSLGYFDLCNNSEDNIRNLGELTNLQDLRLTCSTVPFDRLERNMEVVSSFLWRLGNLKSLSLVPSHSASSKCISCDGLRIVSTPPRLLQKLELLMPIGVFSRLPKWIGQLDKLCVLKIVVREVLRYDIDNLIGLPSLSILSLNVRTVPSSKIIFHKTAFPALKYLKFKCRLLCLSFEEGAMPNLKRLKLGFNAHGAEEYCSTSVGIEFLLSLTEINGVIGVFGASKSDRIAAEHVLINVSKVHPGCPSINIHQVDCIFDGNEAMSSKAEEKAYMSLQETQCQILEKVLTDQHGILELNTQKNKEGRVVRRDKGRKREREMASVSVSTGVMNSLLEKLNSLPCEENYNLKGVRNELVLLKSQLSELNILLEVLAEMDEPAPLAEKWMSQVKELTYDVEDYIDDLSCQGHYYGKVLFARWIAQYISMFIVHSHANQRIQQLTIAIVDAIHQHKRYKLDCSLASPSLCLDTRLPVLFVDSAGLVGIEGPKNKLIKLLMNVHAEQGLKVLSIVGFGGLGKTALANEVYHELGEQFEYRVFVSVTQRPQIAVLLRNMLSQLGEQKSAESNDVQYLISKLREHLNNKRYFIILDDLWDESVWNILSCAFPTNSHGSRVITTTRIETVGRACCAYQADFIYKMQCLNAKDSETLFFSRIFGSKDQCPENLEEGLVEIVRKCDGVPLAIVTVAQHLASRQTTFKEQLESLRSSLCTILGTCSTFQGIRHTLNLSYINLPNYLKTCLLYLGIYPTGYTIRKDDLVKQWVAEGFASSMHGQDAEHVAKGYFNELVNRSVVQPVDTDYNDEVLSFRVHSSMLEFIRYKSAEENFLTVVDQLGATRGRPDKIRRLCLHVNESSAFRIPASFDLSQVRSLLFFGASVMDVSEYRFLRVLILQSFDSGLLQEIDLTGIQALFQLRYLKVSAYITLLPRRIGMLQYLQTLCIEGSRLLYMPPDIVCLPNLSHLIVPLQTSLPDGICNLKSLRTLKCFDLDMNSSKNIKGIGELTSLIELDYFFDGRKLKTEKQDALCCSLGKLAYGKLKYLYISAPGAGYNASRLSNVSPSPRHLEKLVLSGCWFLHVPKWIKELRELYSLVLSVEDLDMSDVRALGGMPTLVHLFLETRRGPMENSITITDKSFPALKHFEFSCRAPCLIFQAGAMPQVERLSLNFAADGWNKCNSEAIGIERLTELKEICVQVLGSGANRLNTESRILAEVYYYFEQFHAHGKNVRYSYNNDVDHSYFNDDGDDDYNGDSDVSSVISG
uniref:AAA+ ATPase domain-containing protein n=1 Tax=Oryza nivara TaxID=4536 RepID=A0A0E0HZV6_ORYNI